MIASLPMYDRPETQAANNRLWALMRDHPELRARNVPQNLTRDDAPFDHWVNPNLVFSQTCSLPYRTELRGKVTLVATPVHDLPCAPGYYYSVIVARRDDPRADIASFHGSTLAYNSANSQSGWAAPTAIATVHEASFGKTVATGSHLASAQAVVAQDADVAGIDAVTWELMKRHDPWTRDLKEIAATQPTPALPYITAKSRAAGILYQALTQAIDDLSEPDRETLCLKGVTTIPSDAYLALPLPEAPF